MSRLTINDLSDLILDQDDLLNEIKREIQTLNNRLEELESKALLKRESVVTIDGENKIVVPEQGALYFRTFYVIVEKDHSSFRGLSKFEATKAMLHYAFSRINNGFSSWCQKPGFKIEEGIKVLLEDDKYIVFVATVSVYMTHMSQEDV